MNIKKIILVLAVVVFIVVAAGFFLFIFPFTGTKQVQAGAMFADGKVFNAVDGISQVFIIDGGNKEVALVDAGQSPDGKPLIDALAARGLKPSDVKAIFFTHGHPDHIGSAKVFSGARIYALGDEVDVIEGKKNTDSPIGRFFPPVPTGIKVTNVLKDGESVKIGSVRVEVFAVPGHTRGGAVYLAEGLLFMGDAALSGEDGRIKKAVWVFSEDVDKQSRSLKALAERLVAGKYSAKQIMFAHSGALDGLQPLTEFAADVK